jgi:hypothetical protein
MDIQVKIEDEDSMKRVHKWKPQLVTDNSHHKNPILSKLALSFILQKEFLENLKGPLHLSGL